MATVASVDDNAMLGIRCDKHPTRSKCSDSTARLNKSVL